MSKRPHSERSSRLAATLTALAFAWLLGGCAGGGAMPKPQPEPEAGPKPEPRDVVRPRIEVDGAYGVTVTEVVRIDSDVRADYQQALVLLQQDRLHEGIALLEQVVERAPEISAPHIDLGVAYGRQGELDAAEESLQTALDLAPDHPAALNEMGIIQRKAGRFSAARASYERALEVLPSYHFALRNLGVLCDMYLEDLNCALENYKAYAEIVGDDAEVGIWIADLQLRLGIDPEEGSE